MKTATEHFDKAGGDMLNAITRTDKLARMCRFNGRHYYAAMLVFYANGMYERAFLIEEMMYKERAYVETQDNPIRVHADDTDVALISRLP